MGKFRYRLTGLLFALVLGIPQIANAGTCIAPPAGLVAWLPGEANANDIVGTSNGTLLGGTSYETGVVGQAFSFDGMDDYMAVGQPFSEEAGTVEFWFLLKDNSSVQILLGGIKDNPDSTRTSAPTFFLSDNDATPVTWEFGNLTGNGTNQFVTLGEWSHVAMTWQHDPVTDRHEVTVYVNGTLASAVQSTSPGAFTDIPPVFVGALNQFGTPALNANTAIDEFSIYDRALAEQEIEAIYLADDGGKCSVINVEVDIKPGSEINSINLCSNGSVPVAVLGADVFSVDDINTESLRFAEAAVKVVGKKDPHELCNVSDINNDSVDDLVCKFVTTDIAGIDGESSSATVNGELNDGTSFEGVDVINIVKDTCN